MQRSIKILEIKPSYNILYEDGKPDTFTLNGYRVKYETTYYDSLTGAQIHSYEDGEMFSYESFKVNGEPVEDLNNWIRRELEKAPMPKIIYEGREI